MEAAIITVGDELLSGEIENTNATWLCERLTARGVAVERVVTLPDRRGAIAEHVRTYSDRFDAVIVTGGLGDTPDDVTMEAVADAFDMGLTVNESVLEDVRETVSAIRERAPEFSVNETREASIPEGARPLVNDDGLSPGCVLGDVYVFPGIPREMKPMFESVAGEFTGDIVSRSVWTPTPEASLVPILETFYEEFEDVTVACYPDRDGDNRLKFVGEDATSLDRAESWIRNRVEIREE